MPKPVFVLNGPNLNRLGKREPEIYGSLTLADIEARAHAKAAVLGIEVDFRQTNHEGELIGWIQEAGDAGSGLVLNAGAYTHTSLAMHDALRGCGVPVVELHLSNVFARERVRHRSYVSSLALGVICGFGADGYELALEALRPHLADGA